MPSICPNDLKQRPSSLHFKAFTILEILVVLSILTILSAVAIPKIKGMQDQIKVSKAMSDLKTLQTGVESYYIHHSVYPDNVTTDLTNAMPQIVSSIFVDPFAPNGTDPYHYSKNGRFYALSSIGLDKINSTENITSSGEVPTGGDDIVLTNGTKTALDLKTDPDNCGAVGTVCTESQACSGGTCIPDNGAICSSAADCAAGQDCIIDVVHGGGAKRCSYPQNVCKSTDGYNQMYCEVNQTCCQGKYVDACCSSGQTCVTRDYAAICCNEDQTPCVGEMSGAQCCNSGQVCGSNTYHSLCCAKNQTPCLGNLYGYYGSCCSADQTCYKADYTSICCAAGETPCLPTWVGHASCCKAGETCQSNSDSTQCL